MPYTKDQLAAIEERNANLLVAAAAGSGKTTVLVERVVRLVGEGANVDEMLIVTFTRAASGDMRDKLKKRFARMAASGDARAREQMERLESASISTIHAFCTELLRENFEAAGIDPQFRVLDDAEDALLTEKALGEALESAYEQGGADMDALDFARGPEKVRELALSAYAFLRERPDADAWAEEAFSQMRGDGRIWIETLEAAAREKLTEALALNRYAANLALSPEIPAVYSESLEEDGRVIGAMLSLDYDNLRLAAGEFKQLTPRSPRGFEYSEAGEALKGEVMSLRKLIKSRVESAAKIVSLDRESSMRDVRDNEGAIRKLMEIARDLDARLAEVKTARAALTFSDLERYALKCLKDDRIAERVREKYRYVFVDEYQDTSDVQEAIVSRISRADNRFMVGDVKQSIYRFRQAEPKLFLEKYARYREGGTNRLIVLKQNFRSRGCVIDFVNRVFARVMNGGTSEIEYDDDAKLYQGASFDGEDAPVELHLIDKAAEAEDNPVSEEEEELSDAEREGVVIARRIHELMKEDPSLRYRDICVLTRVRVNALTCLASALSAAGVPAYADASESYFDALEVMEVMAALRLVANRRRDIDLISVLRSPLAGFTSRELAEVRAETRAESFYDAVCAYAENHEKMRAFLNLLDDWRVLSRAMTIPKLIRRVLSDTGFYAYVGALPSGAQRQANLDVLCSRAAAYESSVGGALTGFLEYAAGMRARGDGDGAHVLGENDDVVRLMTAHKSKGLEFPVVFCSLLGRKFRSTRAEDKLIAHRDLGVALMRMDESLQTRRDTVARRAIVQKTAFEDRAEELRIFYVMLTRAKSRLILTGTVRNLASQAVSWRIAQEFPGIYSSDLDIAASAILSCPGAEALGGRTDGASPKAVRTCPGAEALDGRTDGASTKAVLETCPGAEAPVGHMDGVNPKVVLKTYAARGLRMDASEDENAQDGAELLMRALDGSEPDAEMREAIDWKYPDPDGIHAPVKLTASGLTREVIGAEAIPDVAPRPKFLSEAGLTPTERGTAVHAALRAIRYAPLANLSGAPLRAEVERQLADMRVSGKLSPAEADAVSPGVLTAFLSSTVGVRVRAAERVEREWRFNLRLPASEAIPGAPESSEVIVQGSIDLCFLEDGAWVLVDYKTDRSDDRDALVARYAPQLRLYARALQTITRRPVKEALVCLVRQGEALRVDVS